MRQRTIIAELRRRWVDVLPDRSYEGLLIGGGPSHDNDVCGLIAQMEDVVALDFSSPEFDDDGFRQLGVLAGVRRLEIRSRKLTAKSLPTVERFVQMREIEFVAAIEGDTLAASFATFPHLQRVRACGKEMTSGGLRFVLRCPEMQDLDISHNPLSEGFEVLQRCPLLWKLNIAHCGPLVEAEVAHLGKLKSLTDLDIGGCGIDDAMMTHIASMRRLRDLLIPQSPLTAAALHLLPRLPSLEELMWPAGAIDHADLAAFARLPTLKKLFFTDEPEIPRRVLSRIQQFMPNCRVIQ